MFNTDAAGDTGKHAFRHTDEPPRPLVLSSVRGVQFLRFRLPLEREARLIEAHQAAIESCRASYAAFCAAFLVRLEDDEWLDISFWDGDVDGDGQAGYPPVEARADFISQLGGLLGDESGLLVSTSTDPSLWCD
jgi:hypothetical protein